MQFQHKPHLSKFYFTLMKRAQDRQIPASYNEKHHIIPKSCGGSNDRTNIAHLLPREHLVAHALLVRMTVGEARRSMVFALSCMFRRGKKNGGRTTNTRLEAKSRQLVSEERKGRTFSEEHKAKLRAARAGRPLSAEHLAKLVAAASKARSEKGLSEETKQKLSRALTGRQGRKHTDETRAKMSVSARNRKTKEGTRRSPTNGSSGDRHRATVTSLYHTR